MRKNLICLRLSTVVQALFISAIANVFAHAAESEPKALKTIKDFELKNISSLAVVSSAEQTGLKMTVFNTPKYQSAYSKNALYTGGGATTQLGAGLAGAARDARELENRRKDAKRAVAPTRKAIHDNGIDFVSLFNTELEAAVSEIDWNADVKNYAFVSEKFKKNKFYKTDGKTSDIIVVVEPEYRYSSHLHQLIFSVKLKAYKTLQLMEKQREYSKGELKALKSKYRALNHSPFYRSHVAYYSDTVAPMDMSSRLLTKEEKKARKAEITTYYEGLMAGAKKKDKQKLKKKMKNRLMAVRLDKTFDDGPNMQGKIWLDSDAKLLKETIRQASKELAKLVVLDLNGVQVDKNSQDENSRRLVTYKGFRGKVDRNLLSVPAVEQK